MEITPEQALSNLRNVAESVNGSYQFHVVLQQSLAVLADLVARNAAPVNNVVAMTHAQVHDDEGPF